MITVSNIMQNIITTENDALISAAAKKMNDNERGAVIITQNTVPVGIFSERDVLRLVAEGIRIQGIKITNHYTKRLITTDENTTLEDAARIMEKNHIRRLPVTSKGKIIGIVTANLIAKNMRYSLAQKMLAGSPLDNSFHTERIW